MTCQLHDNFILDNARFCISLHIWFLVFSHKLKQIELDNSSFSAYLSKWLHCVFADCNILFVLHINRRKSYQFFQMVWKFTTALFVNNSTIVFHVLAFNIAWFFHRYVTQNLLLEVKKNYTQGEWNEGKEGKKQQQFHPQFMQTTVYKLYWAQRL